MNKFVAKVTIIDNVVRFGLYVKNSEVKEGMDGMFTKHGRTGTVEVVDMKLIDMM